MRLLSAVGKKRKISFSQKIIGVNWETLIAKKTRTEDSTYLGLDFKIKPIAYVDLDINIKFAVFIIIFNGQQ